MEVKRPGREADGSLSSNAKVKNGWFYIYIYIYITPGTAVVQWLRCCATNRKVAGSIQAGVSGSFIDIKSFRSHYGPGVDSASN